MPGKSGGRFIAARQVVLLHRDHRGQRIAHNHHAQTVIQGGPEHVIATLLLGRGRNRDDKRSDS